MGILHGLVVILVTFEGIIIQCMNIQGLDFRTLKLILGGRLNTQIDFSGFVGNTNVLIEKSYDDLSVGGCYNYYGADEQYTQFRDYRLFESFFKKHGDFIRRITIKTINVKGVSGNARNTYSYTKLAKNLKELRIDHREDESLWEQLSNEEGHILFPKVKKFQYSGTCNRNEFKLNLMFPELESVMLRGTIMDTNCLRDIKTLKELELRTASINEDQFASIFANNHNLKKIFLLRPKQPATMEAIEKYSKNLRSLDVMYPDRNFLLQTNNRKVYNLSSVMNFTIFLNDVNDIDGDLLFDMPRLKNLKLIGFGLDTTIITFIKHFQKLKNVELISMTNGENNVPGRGTADIKKEFVDPTWILKYEEEDSWGGTLVFERKVST